MKIGLFDSGIGGTTTMAEIKKILPGVECVFIADSDNCPYGEKTDEELWPIVCRNVDELISQDVDLIVVACNTATTRCIRRLRSSYPDTVFVGTEPAIKTACNTGAKKILVMATPSTAVSERMALLIEKNRCNDGQEIVVVGCKGLADAIEKKQKEIISEVLDDCLKGVDRDFDVVVLGCTHYPLAYEEIQKRFAGARLIDGNVGVAKRVYDFYNS